MAEDEHFEFEPHEKMNRDLQEISDMALHEPGRLYADPGSIYAAVERGLGMENFYYPTVRVLLDVIARTMTDTKWTAWFEPLSVVIEQHNAIPQNPFQVGFKEVMRDIRPVLGAYGDLDRLSAEDKSDLLRVYIRLFKVLMFHAPPFIQEDLLEQARSIALKLDSRLETARLNQTLALLYAHYGDIITAERYGIQAFSEYEALADSSGIADAACTLAVINRRKDRTKASYFYIDRALSKINLDKPDLRVATLFYEKGAHLSEDELFIDALDYYMRALNVFEEFEAAYQIAMVQQALAQVYLYQHDFPNAEMMIRTARAAWERLGNTYDWINNHFIEGELELQRGSYALALRLLERTIELARERLEEDTPARARLIERVETFIQEHSPPL